MKIIIFLTGIVILASSIADAGTSGDWLEMTTKAPDGHSVGMKIFKNDDINAAKTELATEASHNKFIEKRYELLMAQYGVSFPDAWKTNPFVKYYDESSFARSPELASSKGRPFIIMENLSASASNTYSFKGINIENHLSKIESFLQKKFKNPPASAQMLNAFFDKLHQVLLLSLLIGVTVDDSDIFISLPEGDFTDAKDYISKISIKIADLGEGVNILKSGLTDAPLEHLRIDSCNRARSQRRLNFGLSETEFLGMLKDLEGPDYYREKMNPILKLLATVKKKGPTIESEPSNRAIKKIVTEELKNFLPAVQPLIRGL